MDNDQAIWEALDTSYSAYIKALYRFLYGDIDKISLIKSGLRSENRLTALHLLEFLKPEELQQLFDELIYLASFQHGSIDYVRNKIRAFPREWVLSNIEKAAEPVLENGTGKEYQKLFELYHEMDKDLARRLAERAMRSSDRGVQEAGEDFLLKLEF